MELGSLFSGIGGFELAATALGWHTSFHCEKNKFCRKILKYYWPNATSYEDICTTDFTVHKGHIDILTGGFPCQPYSVAGKRLGKEDDRHLWPQMLRAVREIRPTWVVGENVYGIVNWDEGKVFEEVQADMEKEGYSVQPVVFPACAVGAPHRRDRVWFVAHSDNFQRGTERQKEQQWKQERQALCNTGRTASQRVPSNTYQNRLQRRKEKQKKRKEPTDKLIESLNEFVSGKWEKFPSKPPLCRGNDGIPGKLDGITFSKWREESLKAFGNAIVPQVAIEIFKAIENTEKLLKENG